MPGVYQQSLDYALEDVSEAVDLGIRSIIVFGVPNEKMTSLRKHIVSTASFNVLFVR